MTDTLIVLVHGAWHSSAHWAATQRSLAALGVASVAVDLPGHGAGAPLPSGYLRAGQPGLATERSPLADISMRDNAVAVLDVLARVRSRFRRVVLAGHSAGGGPVSAAAEEAPELLDQLVYLSAFVPAGRPRFFDYLGSPENASAVSIPPVADPAMLGAVRINPLSEDPGTVATIRRSLFGDEPVSSDGWRLLLQPDLPLAIPSTPVTVTAARWGRLPRTFIRLADDLALPPAAQDLMVAEADAAAPDRPFELRDLPGGHSPFLTRPHDLATLLAEIATGERPEIATGSEAEIATGERAGIAVGPEAGIATGRKTESSAA
jgi:pimeloyl-ACP methyl ester carboxylesterase